MSEDPGWVEAPRGVVVPGMTFVCDLPAALGAITAMRVENGRIICDTESGIPFIVAAPSPTGAP